MALRLKGAGVPTGRLAPPNESPALPGFFVSAPATLGA
jgi:hypothetical protein